uniref:Guanine nucleotide-binding protein subunit gamma n=1 Tax=Anolis carolinensis TaxID=28377 RepID=A0A803T500_ANOCA
VGHGISMSILQTVVGGHHNMRSCIKESGRLRTTVSKAAADLMTYCDAHTCEDPLITPVPTSENPFREKKFFCALL